MESKIKSSFIPKDTAQGGPRQPMYTSGAFDLLILGAIILFVASVALAVGVFLYVQFLQSSVSSKTQQLQRAQEAFEPELIAELTRLDDRMNAASVVLQSHIAPTELFRVLEEATLESVSFSSMDFQATDQNNITLSLSGKARSVNAIALQADLFGETPVIVSPIFSNITREEDGVLFDVSTQVNPATISYVNVFSGRNSPSNLPAPEAANAGGESGIPFFSPQEQQAEGNEQN